MKGLLVVLLSLGACGALIAAQTRPTKPLEIYVIDVEGGKADLWITPAGQTILNDTASRGDRDVNRIMDVINASGKTYAPRSK
jgi:competence protein ComEC